MLTDEALAQKSSTQTPWVLSIPEITIQDKNKTKRKLSTQIKTETKIFLDFFDFFEQEIKQK